MNPNIRMESPHRPPPPSAVVVTSTPARRSHLHLPLPPSVSSLSLRSITTPNTKSLTTGTNDLSTTGIGKEGLCHTDPTKPVTDNDYLTRTPKQTSSSRSTVSIGAVSPLTKLPLPPTFRSSSSSNSSRNNSSSSISRNNSTRSTTTTTTTTTTSTTGTSIPKFPPLSQPETTPTTTTVTPLMPTPEDDISFRIGMMTLPMTTLPNAVSLLAVPNQTEEYVTVVEAAAAVHNNTTTMVTEESDPTLDNASPSSSLQLQLPPGWTELYDGDSGVPYYRNVLDGTTTWDRPSSHRFEPTPNSNVVTEDAVLTTKDAIQTEVRSVHEDHIDAPQPTGKSTSTEDPSLLSLPTGWVQLLDDTSGSLYYMNTSDHTTTWDRPSSTTTATTHSDDQCRDTDGSSTDRTTHDHHQEMVPEMTPISEKNGMDGNEDEDARTTPPTNGSHTQEYDDPVHASTWHLQHELEPVSSSPPSADESSTNPSIIPLPHGWIQLYDETSGTPYFLNEIHGLTTWERPTETMMTEEASASSVVPEYDARTTTEHLPWLDHPVDATATEETTSSAVTGEQLYEISNDSYPANEPVPTDGVGDDDALAAAVVLPPGWVKLYDDSSGLPYYMNETDGTTSWDPPSTPLMMDSNESTVAANDDIHTEPPFEYDNDIIATEPAIGNDDDDTKTIVTSNVMTDIRYDEDDPLDHAYGILPPNNSNIPVETEPPVSDDAAATEPTNSLSEISHQRLPPGWVELFDDGSGLPYYMNEVDGTTSWDPPPTLSTEDDVSSFDPISQLDAVDSEVTHDDATTTIKGQWSEDSVHESSQVTTDETYVKQPQNLNETTTLALPDGWIEIRDETSGLPYYLNERDGATSWDPPPVRFNKHDDSEWNEHNHPTSADAPDTVLDIATNETYQNNKLHDDHMYVENEPEMTEPSPPTQDGIIIEQDDFDDRNVSSLPKGWVVLIDETSGQPYYLNEVDGTTSWDPPLLDIAPDTTDSSGRDTNATTLESTETNDLVSGIAIEEFGSDETPNNLIETSLTILPPLDFTITSDGRTEMTEDHKIDSKNRLPNGWIEMYDDDSGSVYYLNEMDGTTSWDPPHHIEKDSDHVDRNGIASMNDEDAKQILCPIDTSTPSTEQVDHQSVHGNDAQPLPSSQANIGAEVENEDNLLGIADDELNNQNEAVEEDDDAYNYVAVLPPGWKEVFDDVSGKPYYFSERDGTIMWARPAVNNDESEMILVTDPPPAVLNNLLQLKRFDDTLDQPRDGPSNSDVGSDETSPLSSILPSGWVELIDETNGMAYYYHERDGVSSWDRPMTMTQEKLEQDIDVHHDGLIVSDRTNDVAPEDVANNDNEDKTAGKAEYTIILPTGWIKLYDESGSPYYFNENDNIVSWDIPLHKKNTEAEDQQYGAANSLVEDAQYMSEEVTEHLSTSDDIVQNVAAEMNIDDASNPESRDYNLPPGWIKANDDVSGEEYYFCEKNGYTSWERPTSLDSDGDIICCDKHEGNDGISIDHTNGDFINNHDAPEATGRVNSNVIPPGWKELVDSNTGQLYFYNETTGVSAWDVPVQETDPTLCNELSGELIVDREHSYNAVDSLNKARDSAPLDRHVRSRQNEAVHFDHLKHSVGRPVSAAASFCFGGRLAQLQPTRQDRSRMLIVRRIHRIVPEESIASIEHNKQDRGIHGPFVYAEEESVLSYVQSKSSTFEDLLWCLISTAAGSSGKLRSMAGVSDSNSPEASIIRLLLQNSGTAKCGELSEQNSFSSDTVSNLYAVEELLLHGKKEEAVEKSLSIGNFALALIIARCCGHEVYARAVQSFADTALPEGMSLRTISLLLSGQLHASGLGLNLPWQHVSKHVLRDIWKNHLAAILSNRTEEWSQLAVSIGDKLAEHDEITAAHFCYMVGGSSVGSISSKSKMVLLGCDFSPWDMVLASDESMHAFNRTEAYEWAKRRGNAQATIQSLQPLKIVYATLLADYGFVDTARHYVASIFDCMNINRDEFVPATSHPGPLSLSVLLSNQHGIKDFLVDLDQRLNGTIPINVHTNIDERSSSENDLNLSFVTAKTNYHDALDTNESTERIDDTPSKDSTGKAQPPLQFQSTVDDFNTEVDSTQIITTPGKERPSASSDFNVGMYRLKSNDGNSTRNGMEESSTIGSNQKELPADGIDTSLRVKVETAPMSAPPNLQSAPKNLASSSAPPSKSESSDGALLHTMNCFICKSHLFLSFLCREKSV